LRETVAELNRKFFVKPIHFEGLQRIEKDEYPAAAIREVLLNALVHRDYMSSFIQIRIYDDKFWAWDAGKLPETITLESLRRTHSSHPRWSCSSPTFVSKAAILIRGDAARSKLSTLVLKRTCPNLKLPKISAEFWLKYLKIVTLLRI
jgi:hypothetical protein